VRLLSLPITTAAGPLTSAVFQSIGPSPQDLTLQANFIYGSGGTAVSAFVQTSIDGLVWCDIANFTFAGSSQRYVFNLSSLTPVTSQYTPTDGTLGANSAVDGVLGHLFRCKTTSTGTYANTTLTIDAASNARIEPQ
jgi:hypothetical protein